ncbi:hypothetical protein T4D_13036, partial [Trichinella pseudospiralis]
FLAIFHVLNSCHIPRPTVDISKFSTFFSFPRHISIPKFSRHIPGLTACISHFSLVKWMFLIFHDFQFSYHIPRPTLDISKFSTYFSFPRHISRS